MTQTGMLSDKVALVTGASRGIGAAAAEVAEAAAWLLSDRASFVTGVVLPVTGGAAV